MQPDYVLSENQKLFVEDAEEQGLDVYYDYSGRGMYGAQCPAVKVDGMGTFGTEAATAWDQMGRRYVIYAPR